MLASLLLAAALLFGLVLVPLGLPGLWVMLGATFAFWLAVPQGSIGLLTVAVVATLVVAAEVVEFAVAGRYARRYGGSRRASWGAILGGVIGAQIGTSVGVRLKAEQLRILLALLVLAVSVKIALDLLIRPGELYSVMPGMLP